MPEQIGSTLHELQVHKIELEMQNEELRQAHASLQEYTSRYYDLYDLAPVGYLTLSDKGIVLEANLTISSLLGVKKAMLAGQYLTKFILSEDQNIYYLHWRQLIRPAPAKSPAIPNSSAYDSGGGASPANQPDECHVCDVRMYRVGTNPFWARIEASMSTDANGATVNRTIISDITKLKHAENALLENNTELTRFNRAAVDRELRMIELKQEVNGLCVRLGLPPAYAIESRKHS
ncbi:MAG: PAS domain-containing protein [bacterium]